MDQNRKFAEMNGLCWHDVSLEQPYILDGVQVGSLYVCTCGIKVHKYDRIAHCKQFNPDFSFAHEVLKVVMEREDWDDFLIWSDGSCEPNYWITVDYITTPGKLRDAWIEWKETT
jgi:hypothetical protein